MMMRRLLPSKRRFGLALMISIAVLAVALGYGSKPAPASQVAATDSGRNVILITWDGVRIDEFLGHPDLGLMPDAPKQLLPYFWHDLAPLGQVYGNTERGDYMTIANLSFISMPAYLGIFAGSPQLCEDNECPRQSTPTFLERLRLGLGLTKDQVATFASWEGIARAVESEVGATFVNAGQVDAPVHASDDPTDSATQELFSQSKKDPPPWSDARFDRYTWRGAMNYLDQHQPRLLYISLDDADGWGHQVEYGHYVEALQNYDQWLKGLVDKLATMGEYGRQTCIIVTTDHGRGLGHHWSTHSNGHPYSGLVMMYAGCPLASQPVVFAPPSGITTHLDIRPSIEALFGLEPHQCWLCGRSLVAQGEGQKPDGSSERPNLRAAVKSPVR
jgi:hypothetical protein